MANSCIFGYKCLIVGCACFVLGVPPTVQIRECQASPPKKTYSASSGAGANRFSDCLSDFDLGRQMKKTAMKGKIYNFFKTKKFIEEKYREDLAKIMAKYNEIGYRDARILSDSVIKNPDNIVDRVFINRKSGVTTIHNFSDNLFHRFFDVDRRNILTGNHNLFG